MKPVEVILIIIALVLLGAILLMIGTAQARGSAPVTRSAFYVACENDGRWSVHLVRLPDARTVAQYGSYATQAEAEECMGALYRLTLGAPGLERVVGVYRSQLQMEVPGPETLQ